MSYRLDYLNEPPTDPNQLENMINPPTQPGQMDSMYGNGFSSAGAPPSSGLKNAGVAAGTSLATGALTGLAMGSAAGPIGGAIGAGIGLGKYFLFDKPAHDRALKLAAATQRYNPWRKDSQQQAVNIPAAVNPIAPALGQASAGAAYGQNIAQADRQNQMNQTWMDYMKARTPQGAPNDMGAIPTAPDASSFGAIPGVNTPYPRLSYGGWNPSGYS